jgi:hypothetical protein
VSSTLRADIEDALETLAEETRLDADALFSERVLEPGQMTPIAAHAAGLIEGAAAALGLTAIEFLDGLGVSTPDRAG